jgi:hypothetical protein
VNGMMLYNLGGVFSEWDDVIKSWRGVPVNGMML